MNLHCFVDNNLTIAIDPTGTDMHYSSEGGAHAVLWVDKPDAKGKTVSFEFGPSTGDVFGGDSIVISSEECGHQGEITIKTDKKQDETAIEKIKQIKNNKPKYNVLSNNCADQVRSILKSSGVDLPIRMIDTPTKSLNDLKRLK